MVIRLLLISLSLGLTLSLIGKTLRNGQVRTQRLTKLILRDTENSRRGFSEDGRNRRTNIDIQFVDANEVKILRNSLGASFITKIKSFSSDRDFTQFLKSTAQKRIAVTQADKQSIIDELLHRVPKMSVHSACDVLWSLGTLKLPLRQMNNVVAVSDMLLASLDTSRHLMTCEDMALALVGLARLGIRCPASITSGGPPSGSFLTALPRTLVGMDSSQVANCMWALGKYGVTWNSLTLPVQKAYKAAIARTGPKMSPLAVANTIHGLSNQRARWELLPSYLTEALSRALEVNVKGMREQEVSNCISGLGRLGAEWTSLSPAIRRSLGDAFLNTIGEGDLPPRGLAMSVHGLGRMNADYTSLPSNFRSSIMSAIHKIAPRVNSLEVSNILYGLGKMGTRFSVDKVITGNEVVATAGTSTSYSVPSFFVPGLAMKGVSSEELDLSIAGRGASIPSFMGSPGKGFETDSVLAVGMSRKARESILDAFNREAGQMNTQGITNSLWGLMLMDSQWKMLSPVLQSTVLKVVYREVGRMNEQELCNTVYALGRLGLRWIDLPSDVKRAVLLAVEDMAALMAPAGVVMTLLGLGRMSFMWGEMSSSLILSLSNAMERVLHSASERTLSGLVHALAAVGAQWGDLSPTLQVAVLEGISKGEAVQQEVIVDAVPPPATLVVTPIAPIKVTPTVISTKRSPERLSRAAFGATAVLQITTIRNWALTSPTPKSPSTTQASTWSQSNKEDSKSKSLSTSSLLNQKSSRAAAALLLNPSSALAPTALVAIQEMISPPNLDMQSFRALIQSQLALQPANTSVAAALPVQSQRRHLSQPVDVSELEFYKAVASKPKVKVLKVKALPVKSKVKDELSKAEKKKEKLKQRQAISKSNIAIDETEKKKAKKVMAMKASAATIVEIDTQNIVKSVVADTVPPVVVASSSTSALTGNHLVYSLGQMGVSWAQLGADTRTTLSDSLILSLSQMGEIGVVNSLHGLTNLGAKWRELREDVQLAFQDALKRVSPDMGEQGVSVAILSLAKLDVCWSDELDEPLKIALRTATARQAHIGEHALSSLLYGLGKLSQQWSGLHPDVQQTLKEAIVVCHLNDRCTPQGVANSLHGLAQMHATWVVLSSSVRLALFAEACKAVPLATETQLSNILGSLGKMGLQWEALPDQLRSRIVTALVAKAEDFNEWHLSTLLFSLGSMGLNWKSLPNPLRSSFINALHRVNALRIVLTDPVTPLSKSWKSKRTVVDYDELLPIVEYIMRKEKKDDRRNRINGNNKRPQISAENQKVLQMNAQGVSMTIVGMSRLAATFDQLSDSLVSSLSLSLQGALPSMNCAQLAATISGLSKAQWRWDRLSMSLKDELLVAITRTASRASPLDMAILMNGMGTMGVRWISLPAETRGSLQIGIKRTALKGVADEVAGVIFGLGMMEISWNILPSDLKKFLKDGILRVCGAKPENVSITTDADTDVTAGPSADTGITGAARFAAASKATVTTSSVKPSVKRVNSMTASKNEGVEAESSWLTDVFDSRVRATRAHPQVEAQPIAVQTMSPQALANLMYAISLLIFEESEAVHEELTPVHIALLDNISAMGIGSSLFSEAEKEQILIYISTLQTLTPLKNSIASRPKCALRADKPFTKPSKLQHSVVSALTTALRNKNSDFEVEDEYSAFSGAFPVDATIFEGDKPVAFVEVNGPQHYREDGRLRRKDLMKEALYRGKYPDASFTRVRFDQVSRLGSRYVGTQVAHFISNTPLVRVRCTAAVGVCPSFFPLFSESTSPDSCTVVYQDCEEDGLAARRAERELVQALSLEGNKEVGAWSPVSSNIHSHAYYLSESFQ